MEGGWTSSDGRRLGYARVSTADQKLRLQTDMLTHAGCDPIFSDHGFSGAKSERPGLEDLLSEARPGDMIVVYRLDRLSRSVQHLSDLIVRFHEDGIHFCSLSEGIDTATPGGKMVFHVFAAFAEFQRDIISENTIEGLRAARRRGATLGRPRAITSEQALEAYQAMTDAGRTAMELAATLGVAPITLSRAFVRYGLGGAS